jgi:uncharacterized protein YndB with AHSA1/START domain
MEKLRLTTAIKATQEKTWKTMLDDATYRQWTEPFTAGSHYIGDWTEGSEILFLGPGKHGEMSGMVARIKENRPFEYVAIEHLGLVDGGRRDTTSEAVKAWAGALETYTLRDTGDGTELVVEVDVNAEYRAMFEETWPKALAKLKALAEQ